jgi:hypothetical protein
MKKGLRLTLAFLTLCAILFTGCGGGDNGVTVYTVTFDTDGGSNVESQLIPDSGLVSQPSNPSKESNSFGGWYKEPACTNQWQFNYDTVIADTTLYAKWNPVPAGSFAVTFNSNGGTIIPDQVIVSGGLVTRPTITKPNAFLDGWYKEAAFTTKWNFTSDTVTSALTLYAKWMDTTPTTVTITINNDDGSALTTISNHPYNTALPAAYFGNGANVPVKAGYRFTGWRNGTTTVTSATRFTQDADLVAGWVLQVTVKFDLGTITITTVDGEDEPIEEEIDINEKANVPQDITIDNNTAMGANCPPTPVLPSELTEDWEFAGWFNGGRQYDGTDRINTTEAEFILTAQWSAIDKTIYTQSPAIHPGNHFMEAYTNATKTVAVNETFTIEGLFANIEAGAGALSAKWYRATTETGEGVQVGTTQHPALGENLYEITPKYEGTETAVGTFWYWLEVTNYNENATDSQYSTARTQNRLKLIVTGL